MKRWALPVLAFLAACGVSEVHLTIYPDGSGKLVRKSIERDAKPPAQEDETKYDPVAEKLYEGAAAIIGPVNTAAGKALHRTTTIYFDDVNAFRIKDRDRVIFSFDYRKGEGGFEFSIHDRWSKDFLDKHPPKEKDAWSTTATVTVPGKIDAHSGWATREGRTASLSVSADIARTTRDLIEPMLGDKNVSWKKHEISDGDLKAFKRELEAARARFDKLKK